MIASQARRPSASIRYWAFGAFVFSAGWAAACAGGQTEADSPAGQSSEGRGEAGGELAQPVVLKGPFASSLQAVAEARGLQIRMDVEGRWVDRDTLLAEVRREVETETPAHVIEATTNILAALELAPLDLDYKRALYTLMGEQLAGFYRPRTKTMFMATDLPAEEQTVTLNHELVHALQDQHYDLETRMKHREDAGDEQSALHALAEGDATSLMVDMLLKPLGKTALDWESRLLRGEGAPEVSKEVPGVMVRSVMAPYLDGLKFVHWARKRGGWQAVDEAWARPPATTEQLLHPEKYLANEPGLSVALATAPARAGGAPWSLSYSDIMGELGVRVVLEEWHPKPVSAAAASGWGGDKLGVFAAEERRAVVWNIRMDDEQSAARLFQALAEGPFKGRAAEPWGICRERPFGATVIARSGRDISWVAYVAPKAAGDTHPELNCAAAKAWLAP